jgi:NitT/TauT family transport system substrate-binding protein
MQRKKANALIVSVIIISAGAFVAMWYIGNTTTPENPVVRIGYLSQDLHQLALRVALVNGWFEEANLTLELVEYQNGGYEMDGFLAGQIDMGYLGAAPALVKRINQNTMVTLLAAVNLEGSALMVMKSEYDAGHVTQVSDLMGKSVYYPGPPTVQSFLLRLALNQSGMSISDINPQTTSVSYMEDALTVDAPAFIAWEPFNAKAEYDGKAVPLLLSGEIWSRHPCCVVAASNEYLTQNPDIVQKVVDIHKRAEEWIVSNPENATQIAIDWLEMDPTPVETAFNRIIYDYNLNRTGIRMYLQFLIHEAQVDMNIANIDSFLDGFIDTSFIEA